MPILNEHKVPAEPVPDNDPLPDQNPVPDSDPVPDHNPVAIDTVVTDPVPAD